MNLSDKYEMISVAYRSRLLFRTDAEYRRALGVSFETVTNKRDSKRDVELYFGILDKEAERVMKASIEDVVMIYTESSEFYLSLDWGDRSQLASRRKFCRMLFRLFATEGRRLSHEEIFKFKIKSDDDRLLQTFFPDGAGELPAVDVRLVALFAFGVLRPFTKSSRGRDIGDKETMASLEKFKALIELLKEDMPRLGSTEKPLIFDETLEMVDRYLADPDELPDCTPLWMWSILTDITRICRSLINAESLRKECARLYGLHMYGIWIDDADMGQNRFWIFPDNIEFAFCYEYDGMMWRLIPYEFRVHLAESDDYYDAFLMATPEGNLDYILSSEGFIGADQLAKGSMEKEWDSASGELTGLTFVDGQTFPEWFSWRSLRRLEREDSRYKRFRALLREIYNPSHPNSLFFKNTAHELTDNYNSLAGRDRKYLYIYDWQPKRCVIQERMLEIFFYEVAPEVVLPAEALFELEISAKNPLYAIPIDIDNKDYDSPELNRLADILSDAENIREVHFIYSAGSPHPRLFFADYSFAMSLDMEELGKIGVLKFTESPFRLHPEEVARLKS